MTPAARVQASIDLLDLIIAAARTGGAPADRIIADWFRARRFAGSGDRRAVRELVYTAIRLCGEIPTSGRAAMVALAVNDPALAALFDGSNYGPPPIAVGEPAAEPGLAPAWLEEALSASGITGAEAAALLDRAPLDLRVNTLKVARDLIELPVAAELTIAPNGLRLPLGTPVEQWDTYRNGLIEVQDSGAQLCCLALAPQPDETVIDLCAGAGGKALALAAAMENRGRIIACDTDRGRLARLAPRAQRAGISMITECLLNPGREAAALNELAGQADAVLVDAPCSGTGTWRRNPEARWRLTPAQHDAYAALQARLCDLAATLLRPGGRLVYVTCSLLDSEGAGQFEAFLARHPGWTASVPVLPAGRVHGQGIRLTPQHDQTDGFFIARTESP